MIKGTEKQRHILWVFISNIGWHAVIYCIISIWNRHDAEHIAEEKSANHLNFVYFKQKIQSIF